MSSGLREHDINADIDRQEKEREEQLSDIELIADEIARIQPGSNEYNELMFFYKYKKQILSVRVFIESIKHID